MKKMHFGILTMTMVAMLSLSLFSACSKDKDDSSSSQDKLAGTAWRCTYNGNEETLKFNSNGNGVWTTYYTSHSESRSTNFNYSFDGQRYGELWYDSYTYDITVNFGTGELLLEGYGEKLQFYEK